jgi:nicotinamide riboside kinase
MRIAFTGPESSGKTTFSKWLSNELSNSVCISEFAREYLEERGITRANANDFKKIVQEQCRFFHECSTNEHHIFDTDIFVLRVWNEEVFKLTLPELELNAAVSMDIHFLCSPDVEWEADPLRSAPDESERQMLFEKYKTELIHHRARFVILQGSFEEKVNTIIDSLNNLGSITLKQ